jgi:hypothetical protein
VSLLGSYNITFDDQGRPILPKAAEEMHRRALAAATSRDTAKIHEVFLEHETNVVQEFYKSVRDASEYILNEAVRFHTQQTVQVVRIRSLIQRFQADAARLALKLSQIQQFEEGEEHLFEHWRREDDLLRHARLAKCIRKQEEGLYKIDRRQLKVSQKAKQVCGSAVATLQKIKALLDRLNRVFMAKYFSAEERDQLLHDFNNLLNQMNKEIHWLNHLELFERKNIALFDKQIKLDFLIERTMSEKGEVIM